MAIKENLVNKRFGFLVVTENISPAKPMERWQCLCDCGSTKIVKTCDLKTGFIKSCGCIEKTKKENADKKLLGKTFGKLTVLSLSDLKKSKLRYWNCQCECGNTCVIRGASLESGLTKSCGCICASDSFASAISERVTKHGGSRNNKDRKRERSKEYNSWRGMRDRCLNPNHSSFKRYGSKGISICIEWDDFSVFLKDMGKMPEDGNKYSIDRIDSNKGYYPENCRWATPKTQAVNRKTTRDSVKSAYFASK